MLTRVDMETDVSKIASQLTQYTMELLTGNLTQPSSDMQSQGSISNSRVTVESTDLLLFCAQYHTAKNLGLQ